MLIDALLIILGVGMLTAGGEVLIRGALASAERLGISPLLSGLLIVGFGTSAPELVVSIDAAMNNAPDIAIGNVVGSNISNILLILGICALISPMAVQPLALRRDALTGILAAVLFLILVGGSALDRSDAFFLLIAMALYLLWAYQTERVAPGPASEMNRAESQELNKLPRTLTWTLCAVIGGLVLLIGGSRLLLTGAVGIAETLGISQAIIGLTLVAVGTSLPELSISVLAAIRGHADVAVGNILGSNIFNLLAILGISAILQPLPVNERILQFDQWVMLAASVLLMLFLYTGRRLSRPEGGVLLLSYIAYLGLSFTLFN